MDSATNLVARAAAAAAGDASAPDDGPDHRLRVDEHVPDGISRIVREQLVEARYVLSNAPARGLGEAIHDTRKRLKLVRAVLRLARDGLGEETYDRENATLRRAGQRLSPARDAQVLLDTLEALRERFDHELPDDATDVLRGRLQDDRRHAQAALREDDRDVAAVLDALQDTADRTAAWTLEPAAFAALAPGLRRIHRRGRRALRVARKDPSAENLHELRKRVKDLRHASEVVCAARPKRLRKVAGRAHEVGDLLGDNHDLHVLRAYVESHPHCFADESSMDALLAVIDRRAALLCERALKRAKRLYTQSPKRFVAKAQRGWNKRAASSTRPLSG
jgi:CHAD domain-containing protein